MQIRIQQVVLDLLEQGESRTDIADNLEVTPALISTWLQKDNDFCPRLNIAKRLYEHYNIIVYPYSKEAVNEA